MGQMDWGNSAYIHYYLKELIVMVEYKRNESMSKRVVFITEETSAA